MVDINDITINTEDILKESDASAYTQPARSDNTYVDTKSFDVNDDSALLKELEMRKSLFSSMSQQTPDMATTSEATPPPFDIQNYLKNFKEHEGFRNEPYPDIGGGWAIGYGQQLKESDLTGDFAQYYTQPPSDGYSDEFQSGWGDPYKGLNVPESVASQFLEKGMSTSAEEAKNLMGGNWVGLPDDGKYIMSDLVYNMGLDKFTHKNEGFPKFIAAMKLGDYATAAKELRYNFKTSEETSYYTADGKAPGGTNRAKDHIKMLNKLAVQYPYTKP